LRKGETNGGCEKKGITGLWGSDGRGSTETPQFFWKRLFGGKKKRKGVTEKGKGI